MYIITYECRRHTMKPNVIFLIICAMFFITGCTNNHLNNAMINSNAVQVGDSWSPLDSIERAGVIHCEAGEDNYSFEVHAYDGSFLVKQQDGQMQYVSDLVIEVAGDAHWENVSSNGEILPWDGEKTFIGVLIKQDDQYVGYAAIMIERPENNWRYNATIINCKEIAPEERSNSEIMSEDLYKMIDSAVESAK